MNFREWLSAQSRQIGAAMAKAVYDIVDSYDMVRQVDLEKVLENARPSNRDIIFADWQDPETIEHYVSSITETVLLPPGGRNAKTKRLFEDFSSLAGEFLSVCYDPASLGTASQLWNDFRVAFYRQVDEYLPD